MSEEERKGKHKPKIISYIARIAGIAAFLGGLLIVPYACCDALVSSGELDEYFFTHFILLVGFSSLYFLCTLFAIILVLSIVTFFTERAKRFRLRLLAFVLAVMGLYVTSEEERKETADCTGKSKSSKLRKIVTFIAVLAGIITVLSGLVTFPLALLMTILPIGKFQDLDIGLYVIRVFFWPMIWFWPIAGICLALFIVKSFIERDKHFRFRPLVFVLAGVLLYAAYLFVFFVLINH